MQYCMSLQQNRVRVSQNEELLQDKKKKKKNLSTVVGFRGALGLLDFKIEIDLSDHRRLFFFSF